MKKLFLLILISCFCLPVFSVNKDSLVIYEVELPEDSNSISLLEYFQAKKYSDVPAMDSFYYSTLANYDNLNAPQQAIWHFLSGYYFLHINLYDKADKNFSKSVQLGERLNERLLVLYARNGLAGIDYSYGKVSKAIEKYYQVIYDSRETDWQLRGSVYGNIGALQIELSYPLINNKKKFDSLRLASESNYKKSINIFEINEGFDELERIYAIYATNLMLSDRVEESKEFLLKANEASLKTNNVYRYHFNLIKWSEYHRYIGKYKVSIDTAKKALKYFRKEKVKNLEYYSLVALAYNFSFGNRFDSAFSYIIKANTIKTSINLEKMGRQSEQYKVELDVYDKENKIIEQAREIELQEFENQISEANLKRWIIGGLSAVAIAMLVAFIFIQNVKQRAKVERAQLIITEREQAYRSVIEGQERERKRIAQELHDGIGQQLSGIKMALQNMSEVIEKQEGKFTKELTTIINLVGVSSSEVRNLAHQMLPQVLDEKGLSEALKDLIQSVYQTTKIKFNFDYQLGNKTLDKGIELTIYRSAQELINNTIKHAEASEIDLYVYNSSSHILVAYSDNGKGMNEQAVKNGLGLNGIRHRVENYKGMFSIEESKEIGFSAMIKLPKT